MVEVRAWGVAPGLLPLPTDLAELLITINITDNGNGTFGVGDLITVGGVERVIGWAFQDAFIIDGVAVQVAALYLENGPTLSIPYVDGKLAPAYPAVASSFTYGDFFPAIPFPASDVICFARGTTIACACGNTLIENLKIGDTVETKDHGAQPIRWIGSTKLDALTLERSPNLRPIRIKAGALGHNSPETDLVVSPQHRVLVRSKIAQKMFSTDEVLVAAKQLLQLDGIEVADDLEEVEYFHILFDQHEVIKANGAETESLYTGTQALKSVGAAARREIFALFPELGSAGQETLPARPLVTGRMGRQLALRHWQNVKTLVQ